MISSTLNATRHVALLIVLAGPVCLPAVADPVPATATTPSGKLVASFSDFAGSPENSASLVNGLRTGAPITLTDPAVAGGPPPNSTTFTAPTKPMGYGNVRIALSLAQARLASEGITSPTAAELQGALIGRTYVGPDGVTTTDGVLQMRAAGMGWGKIANTMGYKLGPVMSGKQTLVATHQMADTTVTKAAAPSVSVAKPKGVVSASDGVSDGSRGGVTGSGTTSGGGKGIVTGTSGTAAGKGVVTGSGNVAHGQSGGITTGLGHGASSAGGVTTAAGNRAGGNAASSGKGGGKP